MDENRATEKNEIVAIKAETGKACALGPLTTPQAVIWCGLMISAAVIIAAVIVVHRAPEASFTGTAAEIAAKGTAAAPSTTPVAVVSPDIKKVATKDEPYIGSATAPVTLAYWSDYQCPYCKKFETETLPSIIKTYVDSGKVKIVFKDFPFLGDDSTIASLYARAVWELYPSQFFAWRTAMFNAQDGENTGFGDEASIQKLSATIPGIDAAQLTATVSKNQNRYSTAIGADRDETVKFGIQGTPAFITGTTLIPGVAPFSTFQAVIDSQLK